MELQLPSWFKYRQGTAEPAGDNCYKLSAPLADDCYIRVYQKDGRWQAALANAIDEPDLRVTEPVFSRAADAWLAAFELYRAEKIY